MNDNNALTLKNRQVTLTEFGYITAVHEFDGWVEIENETNQKLVMIKAFHRWPNALRKCRDFLAKNFRVVTRCGVTYSSNRYFNEVYIDPCGAPLLAFPNDGKDAPNTVEQLVMERVWKQEVWAEDNNKRGDLNAELVRFGAAIDQQSERDKFLTERTTKFLNSKYPIFSTKRVRYLYIDEHTRRRAAMRLGINLTGHSNLKVHLEGHLYNTNFIHVTLPDFEGIDGVIGLHRKEDGNQWISTINNGDSKWWSHEQKVVSNKDIDRPITHYLEIFQSILARRHDLGKKGMQDNRTHQTVIKFPKKLDT